MFNYDDGRIHESVEAVVGESHRVTFKRSGSTTQYVAPNQEVMQYKQSSESYESFVDGQKINNASLNSSSDCRDKAEKKFWNTTPYIRIRSKSSSSSDKPISKLIFVIPGNPGLCEFYAEFIEALSELVDDAEIVSVSYSGYNIDNPKVNGSQLHMLNEQIEHINAFFDFYLNKIQGGRSSDAPKLHVSLLGHSVGSWIVERVATHRRSDLDFVGSLTPTVKDIRLSERGKSFTELTRYFGSRTVWSVVHALKWVPFYQLLVTSSLARIMPVTEVNGMARDASLGIALSPQICRQIVGSAIEEMERIGPDVEPSDIAGFWEQVPQIWACFAEHDHWVPNETRAALLEHVRPLPNVRAEIVPVPHAFVLRESDTVAASTAKQINKL